MENKYCLENNPLLGGWLHFTNKEHVPFSSQLRICRKVTWCVPAVDLHMGGCNANRCSSGAVSVSLCCR